MLDYRLFLGFRSNSFIEETLQTANPHLVTLFLGSTQDEYLCRIEKNDHHYIGKFLPELTDIDDLEQLQNHVLSIAHRLVPDLNLEKNPLTLFTVSKSKVIST